MIFHDEFHYSHRSASLSLLGVVSPLKLISRAGDRASGTRSLPLPQLNLDFTGTFISSS